MTPNYQGNIAILGMGSTGLSVARFLLRHHIACEAFDEHRVSLPDGLNILAYRQIYCAGTNIL